jgi:haloalkane dehalogenase
MADPALPAWLDASAYPFTPKRFACDEGEISYLDVGEGEPVLFVHGTPSWSFEWRVVIDALAPARRCIAPDHLGFGLSDKPASAPLRPEDHARRLELLVRALDLRDLTLVVHDFGAPIGAQLALQAKQRLRRIVVLNSWLWPNGGDAALRWLDRLVRSPLGKVLYLGLNVSPRWLLPAATGRRALPSAVHGQYLGPFTRRGSREGPYKLARALVGSDAFYATLWSRRDELTPLVTDLVWGLRDPALKLAHLARWREAFPSAAVHVLPEVGHFVAEEAPHELVRVLERTASTPAYDVACLAECTPEVNSDSAARAG